MSDADLVVLRSYLVSFEAEVPLTALRAAGIEALKGGEDHIRPYLGVSILVRGSDRLRAEEVLRGLELREV
jgi:hypothetical protein